MKTKALFGICAICIASLLGCEQQENGEYQTNNETEGLYALYKDSVFYKIEGDLNDPEVIWGNHDVYGASYERLRKHLRFENNRLVWDIKSGKEVGVSENIFEYVVGWWEICNQQLESDKYMLEILEDDYFSVLPVNDEKGLTKAVDNRDGRIVLEGGRHSKNMYGCIEAMQIIRGKSLACVINEPASDLRPDGYGGRMIRGKGTNREGEMWGYYVCDPCAPNERFTCELNVCNGFQTRDGVVFYNKAVNRQGYPLITLRNEFNFENN